MSANDLEEWQDRIADIQSNFGHGLGLLAVLAGHNPATVSRDEMLEIFAAFEASYGPLAEDQAAGRLWMSSGGVLTQELHNHITRLGALLRLPPESAEAKDAAPEIRVLAAACLRAIQPEAAPKPPSEPSEPQ